MQCQAQDAKFSQLNEQIATTQCTRQCRQKWDICDFCIPNLHPCAGLDGTRGCYGRVALILD